MGTVSALALEDLNDYLWELPIDTRKALQELLKLPISKWTLQIKEKLLDVNPNCWRYLFPKEFEVRCGITNTNSKEHKNGDNKRYNINYSQCDHAAAHLHCYCDKEVALRWSERI